MANLILNSTQEFNALNNNTPTLVANNYINCIYADPKVISISNNNFICISFNIRSTDKNLNNLKLLLGELSFSPDVILLQEIWQDNLNFQLKGYTKFSITRNNKKGGGTAILIKAHYNSNIINELTFINGYIEITTIKAKINSKSFIIYVQTTWS